MLFVIDKIGNFVTIPVHAFGSESEHSTIYVPMFGGRISIGVQSKRFFFSFTAGWDKPSIPFSAYASAAEERRPPRPEGGRWSQKTITSLAVSTDLGYHQSSFIAVSVLQKTRFLEIPCPRFLVLRTGQVFRLDGQSK